MCEICRTSPCVRRCPNAPIQKEVLKCENCKDGVKYGERYAVLNDVVFCENCLEDLTVEEIFNIAGIEMRTVEEDEFDDRSSFYDE